MRAALLVVAVLILAGCAFSPRRCERRLAPINTPTAIQARTGAVRP